MTDCYIHTSDMVVGSILRSTVAANSCSYIYGVIGVRCSMSINRCASSSVSLNACIDYGGGARRIFVRSGAKLKNHIPPTLFRYVHVDTLQDNLPTV